MKKNVRRGSFYQHNIISELKADYGDNNFDQNRLKMLGHEKYFKTRGIHETEFIKKNSLFIKKLV